VGSVLGGGRGEEAGGGGPRRHIGELELDRLVVGDRLAERGALLRVTERRLESRLGHADGGGGGAEAREGEGGGDRLVAAPGGAEDVARGEPGTGEGDCARVHAAKPERGEGLAEPDARCVAADEERDGARLRARLDEEPRHPRRVVRGRCGALEAPAVAVAG